MKSRNFLHTIVLTLFFLSLGSTSALASYTTVIATPSPSFGIQPGSQLAVGGSSGWTFGFDYAVYHVEIAIYDSSGHQDSTWAACNVGYQLTTYTGTVTTNTLQPTAPGGATLLVTCYDTNMNYLAGSSANESGTIIP